MWSSFDTFCACDHCIHVRLILCSTTCTNTDNGSVIVLVAMNGDIARVLVTTGSCYLHTALHVILRRHIVFQLYHRYIQHLIN